LMMSLWDALRMNMMISYQELVRTFPHSFHHDKVVSIIVFTPDENQRNLRGHFAADFLRGECSTEERDRRHDA
ncbi:hypothetical protein, partial [Raoultella ornithinolytica]|uniref:hypothetical protein n=1 Tax=Raoultella ornithinolytica TaxID=54291 RepID=UPI003983A17A